MLTPSMYCVDQRRLQPQPQSPLLPPLSPLLHDVRQSPKTLLPHGHQNAMMHHHHPMQQQHSMQQAFEQRGRREDFFRVRTASLGSAASSSRSPGRDSVNSQDSSCGVVTLASSASSSSSSSGSPSPSPPSPPQEGSTLFNILKGNLSSPYARLFRTSPSPVCSSPRCRCGCSSPRAGCLTPPVAAAAVKRSHSECVLPGQHQDEPIDLSCKRSRTQSTPAGGAGDSILEAILCGRAHSDWAPALGPRPPSVSSSMAPPASPAGSESSVASSLSGGGSARVSLAKKNLFPVCARVTDWLNKMAAFCWEHEAFCRLTSDEQLNLLRGAWPRLLLLDMAETHFEFAVSGSSSSSTSDDDATTPTMHDVEKVQGFIRRCQALETDPDEFRLLRTATLFQRAVGLGHDQGASIVEDASAAVRHALQDHVTATRPDEKMRYSALLLCLHALCGVNARALEALFCSHLTKSSPMEKTLRRLLFKEQT